jgi:hypothetical protein
LNCSTSEFHSASSVLRSITGRARSTASLSTKISSNPVGTRAGSSALAGASGFSVASASTPSSVGSAVRASVSVASVVRDSSGVPQ